MKFNSNTRLLDCEKIRGDIKDYQTVQKVVDGKDIIVHLAAVSRVAWGQQDPYNCWLTNLVGTVNALEACRKSESRPVLLEASSREVYGEPLYLPVNESHPKRPKSVYGLTKLGAERACLSYSDTSGLDRAVNHAIMRFSNVYGSERDLPERVIPKFMNQAMRGEYITLYGVQQSRRRSNKSSDGAGLRAKDQARRRAEEALRKNGAYDYCQVTSSRFQRIPH